MAFTRHLGDPFVDALNDCYQREGSWWRRIADDPDVFIAIRDGYLNVYVSGGSLLRVGYTRSEGLVCSIHEEYLILRSPRAYVRLTRDQTPEVEMVQGTDGLAARYSAIKRRIARFSHPERAGENVIASRLPCIVDMEAAFSWEKGEPRRGRVGRVDLVALAPSGKLVLIEAKLLASPELRDGDPPSVVCQLGDYHAWLRKDRLQLVKAYQHVIELYRRLRGRFLQERVNQLADTKVLDVHARPRLLIFGFSEREKREYLKPLVAGLCQSSSDGRPTVDDIVTVGDPRNLTGRALLRGV